MQLAVGGALLRVKAAGRRMPTVPSGRRGVITGFSPSSRRRLMDLLNSINRQAVKHLPLFITLTYPAVWPQSAATWKRHLDNWLKRLKREWPDVSCIWRLEFQKRGAPHFHILAFGCRFLPAKWVAEAWYSVVGSGDKSHLGAGTQVKRVASWRGVVWYAAKYMSKEGALPSGVFPGRLWGVHNRHLLPIEMLTFVLTFGAYFRARRVMVKYMNSRARALGARSHLARPQGRRRIGGPWQGLKVYGNYTALLQLLRSLA